MTLIESTLFAILRSALGIRKLASPVNLTAPQWKMLLAAALQQQVAALVFEVLNTNGSNMPDAIKSKWQKYSDFSARRFDAQLMALTQLSAILEAENVRMMVLKGMGLALCYPQPQLRECGDIDIFCYGDYDKVNEFVVSSGLDPKARETEEKHFGFEIGGIEVENHRKFCTDNNRANIYIGNVLMEMSADQPHSDPRLPGILFPSVQMGALHLVAHTLMHLWWSGITLRHLCDVTAYFRRHKAEIDFMQLRSVLAEAGLEKSAALLFDLCNRHLGLDLDLSEWQQYGEDAAETVLRSIFHPFKNSCFTRDPFRKFHRKVVMHRFRSRLYRLVYVEKYQETFLGSFVIFTHPVGLHRLDI